MIRNSKYLNAKVDMEIHVAEKFVQNSHSGTWGGLVTKSYLSDTRVFENVSRLTTRNTRHT